MPHFARTARGTRRRLHVDHVQVSLQGPEYQVDKVPRNQFDLFAPLTRRCSRSPFPGDDGPPELCFFGHRLSGLTDAWSLPRFDPRVFACS